MSKVVSAAEAVGKIRDGDTVIWTSVGLAGFCHEVALALEKRFLDTGAPRNLTIAHDSGCGDGKTPRGMNVVAHEGLVRRLISGHTGHAPKMGKLINDNLIEAYLLPQGVMTHLWRHVAGKKPGVITKIGLGTYVDPRRGGGKVSPRTTEELVKLIELEGEEWLLYKPIPVNVAVIRASVADERGNLTMEREPLLLEGLPMAQAARNCGGIVIAQVEYLAKTGTLHPQKVKIPGVLVDYIVVATSPANHMQAGTVQFDPALCGDTRVPLVGMPPLPMGERKIMARRAALELKPDKLVNLGIGVPDGISSIAAEEGVLDLLMLTTEVGTYGGMPVSGKDFGCTLNAEAIIEHHSQFDFYDGGGLDYTFLGMAQVDRFGNVNVSKFGQRVVGSGGFINISQSAKQAVFCGAFTDGAEIDIRDGQLHIVKEGTTQKFVADVDQITFSGEYSQKRNQPVLYITERAVFRLMNGKMTLIEVAPGIDVERDVLGQMGFRPEISPQLTTMPPEIFAAQWGLLKRHMERQTGA